MKRVIVGAICVLASAALCHGGAVKIGAHGAYSMGGDVEESDLGLGAQVNLAVNEAVSLEISATKFSDEPDPGLGVDVTTIALTAQVGGKVGDNARVYAGGGVNYNMMDANVSAAAFLGDELPLLGVSVGMDVDNSVGYHVCAGLEMQISDNVELFGEYRYSFVDVEGEFSASWLGFTESESFSEDYDFGMVRVGINVVLP